MVCIAYVSLRVYTMRENELVYKLKLSRRIVTQDVPDFYRISRSLGDAVSESGR